MKLPCTVDDALALSIEEEDYVWRAISRQPEALHDCRVAMQGAQLVKATTPRKQELARYWSPGWMSYGGAGGEW